jgi:hypothetical protein
VRVHLCACDSVIMRNAQTLVLFFAALLVGCSGADIAPRNLVCERVAVVTPKAVCVPEMSDAGDTHTHSARVTLEGDKPVTVVCALNAGQISMVCGDLEQTQRAPSPPQ